MNSLDLAFREEDNFFNDGINSSVMAFAAATCIEVGITSLEDCPVFTWSLGWTGTREPNSPPNV